MPRQRRARALLSPGHTLAHAPEAGMGHDGSLPHGEAASIGLVPAFRLSVRLGLEPPRRMRRGAHPRSLGLMAGTGDRGGPLPVDRLPAHMRQHTTRDGQLTFILRHGIGQFFGRRNVEKQAVRAGPEPGS